MQSSPLSLQEQETIKKIRQAHRVVAGVLIFVAVLMTGICIQLACHLPDGSSAPVFAYLLLILVILCVPILFWWLAVWGIKRILPFTRALKTNEKTVIKGRLTNIAGKDNAIVYSLGDTKYELKFPFTGIWAIRFFRVTDPVDFPGQHQVILSFLSVPGMLLSTNYPDIPANEEQIQLMVAEDRAALQNTAWKILRMQVGLPVLWLSILFLISGWITGIAPYIWITVLLIITGGLFLFILAEFTSLLNGAKQEKKIKIKGLITEKIELRYTIGKSSQLSSYWVRVGSQLFSVPGHDKAVGDAFLLEFVLNPDGSMGSMIRSGGGIQ